MEINNDFSSLVKAARFPLICLVVLAHSPLTIRKKVSLTDGSGENIYNFITQGLAHNYAIITICCFFIFSGYFLFKGLDTISVRWCIDKWKSRIRTLLLPFICWNLLAIGAIAIKNAVFGLFGHYCPDEMTIVSLNHILDWFRMPADYPLWYLEDLMFMTLVSPVIYIVINKLRNWTPAPLLLVYFSPWNPSHVSMIALFFFSLGAWCNICKFDILQFCRKHRISGHLLAIITLIFAIVTNDSPYHYLTLRLFLPFGIISFFNIIYVLTRDKKRQMRLQNLSGSVFFIYAVHEIYILGWTKGVCLRLFGESLPAMYIRFFLVPLIVIAVSYGIYCFLHKYTPKTLSFLCGGR